MVVVGTSERGRGMAETERAQVAEQIAIDTQGLIAR
jgi:hypothetical protein